MLQNGLQVTGTSPFLYLIFSHSSILAWTGRSPPEVASSVIRKGGCFTWCFREKHISFLLKHVPRVLAPDFVSLHLFTQGKDANEGKLIIYHFIYMYPLLSSSALLDALTKNGSSMGNGAYRRRPAESSESTSAQPERERQESGGGDSSKGFTKEQVEGVQRWEFKHLLGLIFQPVSFTTSYNCNLSHFTSWLFRCVPTIGPIDSSTVSFMLE